MLNTTKCNEKQRFLLTTYGSSYTCITCNASILIKILLLEDRTHFLHQCLMSEHMQLLIHRIRKENQTLRPTGCASCSLLCFTANFLFLHVHLQNNWEVMAVYFALRGIPNRMHNLLFCRKAGFVPDCHWWLKIMAANIISVRMTAGDIIRTKKSIPRQCTGRADAVPARLNRNYLNNGIIIVWLCCVFGGKFVLTVKSTFDILSQAQRRGHFSARVTFSAWGAEKKRWRHWL